jgi:single-strand DNA-binding protein
MLNQLTLMGRLTRDVEIRHSPGGTLVAKGAIAVDSYAGKDKDGAARKRTLFLDFVAFETTGDNIGKHFKKGDPILLVGELVYQTWEKDGQKRSKHEMNVQRFSFIPGSGGGERDVETNGRGGKPAAPPRDDNDVPF